MRIFAEIFYKGGVKRQYGRASTHVLHAVAHRMHHSLSLFAQFRCVRNKSAGSLDVGVGRDGCSLRSPSRSIHTILHIPHMILIFEFQKDR